MTINIRSEDEERVLSSLMANSKYHLIFRIILVVTSTLFLLVLLWDRVPLIVASLFFLLKGKCSYHLCFSSLSFLKATLHLVYNPLKFTKYVLNFKSLEIDSLSQAGNIVWRTVSLCRSLATQILPDLTDLITICKFYLICIATSSSSEFRSYYLAHFSIA